VSGRASESFATGASQTFITPSRGASHDSHWPSGESWAPERLGLPNSLLRSMSGAACSAAWAGIQAGVAESAATSARVFRAVFMGRILVRSGPFEAW